MLPANAGSSVLEKNESPARCSYKITQNKLGNDTQVFTFSQPGLLAK